jgi:hypothetical protein
VDKTRASHAKAIPVENPPNPDRVFIDASHYEHHNVCKKLRAYTAANARPMRRLSPDLNKAIRALGMSFVFSPRSEDREPSKRHVAPNRISAPQNVPCEEENGAQ